jgi:lambda family phage portal protein
MARKSSRRKAKTAALVKPLRNFAAGAINSRLNASWIISGLSGDMEIRQGLWTARERIRALEWDNDYVRKFLVEIVSNVLGAEGMILQMKVKEEADRIIHDGKELDFILSFQRERNEKLAKFRRLLVRKGVSDALSKELVPELNLLWQLDGTKYRAQDRSEGRAAMVRKGQPDVYANTLIEKAWKRFSKKENFTVTKQLSKREFEGLHFRTTARDGTALIRKIKGFDNEFGFALELINADWLDLNYSTRLNNGNEVRMGVEFNSWRQPVAYWIITRQPNDWSWNTGIPVGGFTSNQGSYGGRRRVDAVEILHPFVRERIDQSREVPWLISSIVRLQMLGKYEEAELIASMAAACKIAVRYSEMNPEGGAAELRPDPTTGEYTEELEPGMIENLPWGVKMDMLNPTHPNGNYDLFRKGMLRGLSVGMPGQVYYALSQDQESVNFSTARMSELPARDVYMGLQHWESENVHQPIFRDFLEAGLLSGQIKLSMSKLDIYAEAANWIGRRWKGIDLIKEAQANKMNLLMAITTRAKIIAESTQDDFEEMIFDLANEEELIRSLGLDALLLENFDGPKLNNNSTSDASAPGDIQEPAGETPPSNGNGKNPKKTKSARRLPALP